MASLCWMPGRVDESVRYSDVGQLVIGGRPSDVPFGVDGWLGSVYMVTGQPERWAEWCRAQLAQRSRHPYHHQGKPDLRFNDRRFADEAMAAANGLIEAAEKLHNPYALSFALSAYGYAFGDADPVRALDAMRRGLVIARDSGNRFNESILAQNARAWRSSMATPWLRSTSWHWRSAATTTRATLASCPSRWLSSLPFSNGSGATNPPQPSPGSLQPTYWPWSIRRSTVRSPSSPKSSATRPTNRSPARAKTMTTAEMVTYAYDQIDQARAELKAVSK